MNKSSSSSLIRLNKFISDTGFCSRRKADIYISNGKVKVNDRIVTELGTKISPDDLVYINGKPINPDDKKYILLNKPKDTICTTFDPQGRKTVLDIVKLKNKRIYPIGRLDRNTTGILLLTNDGSLTNKLLHPSGNIKKSYIVKLNKTLKKNDLIKLLNGVMLEDGLSIFDSINEHHASLSYRIIIHSGKNRIIRRTFESLNYSITKLHRDSFAGISDTELPPGKWRFLHKSELNHLKNL